jgi:hypothetical protein
MCCARDLDRDRDSISRWFRELQHYGFIVMTEPGSPAMLLFSCYLQGPALSARRALAQERFER